MSNLYPILNSTKYLKEDELEILSNIRNIRTKYATTHFKEDIKDYEKKLKKRYDDFIYNSSDKVFSYEPGFAEVYSDSNFKGVFENIIMDKYNELNLKFSDFKKFISIFAQNEILKNLIGLKIENILSTEDVVLLKRLKLPNLRKLSVVVKDDNALEELFTDPPEFIWSLVFLELICHYNVFFNRDFPKINLPFVQYLKVRVKRLKNDENQVDETKLAKFMDKLECSTQTGKYLSK